MSVKICFANWGMRNHGAFLNVLCSCYVRRMVKLVFLITKSKWRNQKKKFSPLYYYNFQKWITYHLYLFFKWYTHLEMKLNVSQGNDLLSWNQHQTTICLTKSLSPLRPHLSTAGHIPAQLHAKNYKIYTWDT